MSVEIKIGDCRDVLRSMPDESVHCVVTSPPYFGLRDYGHDGQIGLEATPAAFVSEMVDVAGDAA
jgi:DNA modification methylase